MTVQLISPQEYILNNLRTPEMLEDLMGSDWERLSLVLPQQTDDLCRYMDEQRQAEIRERATNRRNHRIECRRIISELVGVEEFVSKFPENEQPYQKLAFIKSQLSGETLNQPEPEPEELVLGVEIEPEPKPEPKPERTVIGVIEQEHLMNGRTMNKSMTGRDRRAREEDDGTHSELKARTSKISFSDGTSETVAKTTWDLSRILCSQIEIYRVVADRMRSRYGLIMRLDHFGKGLYSNHQVFETTKPPRLPGISYPSNFKILQPVPVSRAGEIALKLKQCIQEILKVAEDIVQPDGTATKVELGGSQYVMEGDVDSEFFAEGKTGEVEFDQKAFRDYLKAKVNNVFRDFELFNKTASQCAVLLSNEEQAYTHPISVDGTGVANRWVPQIDWFDDSLREIPNEKLLSLLPEAERNFFMLMLGRCLYGREGTPHTNGKTQMVKWRGICLMEGREGGMGRTTLLDYLSQGLKRVGYHVSAIQNLTGTFGHGRTATTDFGFQDDMTPAGTITALCNPILKSVSSGGVFSAEEKGMQSREVTGMGVYMLCTNRFDLSEINKLDSGNLSRLYALRNATSTDPRSLEYAEKYGHLINTNHTYDALMEEYGVSAEVLVMLLLARSAQMFRKFSDSKNQIGLIKHLNQLRSEFQIQTDANHVDDLVRDYVRYYTMAAREKPKSFEPKTCIQLIQRLAEFGQSITGVADDCDSIKSYALMALNSGKKGMVTLTKSFFECLTSKTGMSYPIHPSDWIQKFSTLVNTVDVEDIYDKNTYADTNGKWGVPYADDELRLYNALKNTVRVD